MLVIVVVGVCVALTFLGVAARTMDGSREASAAAAAGSAPTTETGAAASSGRVPDRVVPEQASRARPPSPAHPAPRYAAETPVLLLGDSLDVGIADQLAAAWPERSVTVEAEIGRSTSTAAALLADQADSTAPVWVVSLGTNDAPEDFPAAARELLRLAGPSRCVLWYDIHRPADQDAINATLGRLASRSVNLHVLGWHALAEAYPEWVGWDGIHPTTEGYLARAAMATDAVARYCTTDDAGSLGPAPDPDPAAPPDTQRSP